ncbi:molybdopterin molybdenumtransferase [Paraglaciecola hydrolytica]|uniref:Molybdopterin molybdenumtransferase n=2 Tax=Paraglaciecola hydrolytica TaxID=1799789 RepID=A0A136A623_9ALTE|nr:molybdopterin molybdenumtransferase [Paraglaciecola hydrolytica]
MPLSAAIDAILDAIEALNATESISLHEAHKRVLAIDIISTINVPPADNSAMDGYALRSQDLATTDSLELIGTALAGTPFTGNVAAGQCVRIMTGGVIPQGADCVVMQENTQANDKLVRFMQQYEAGNNVRKAGEDIAAGQLIIKKGTLLGPAHLALLASIGQASVTVTCQLTVGLIATGDELTTPGQSLKTGAIYESNSYALAAMLENLKLKVINYGIVADELNTLRNVFTRADNECDLVISCGGVSVGEADFVKDILAEAGHINFWKVAIKPGKPFAFGRLAKTWFCGLPGNPVSSFVTFELLVKPLIRKLSGQNDADKQQPYFVAKAASLIRKRPGRADFQRGYFYRDDNDELWVKAQGNQSSGVMSSLTNANCYLLLAQEQGDINQTQDIKILPFSNLFTD